MKILNLYAGVGGNRRLWGNEHDITAVESNEAIAEIYKDIFPGDNIVVGDAHQYLLDRCHEFDFIWSSPPCPTHSITNYFLHSKGIKRYPDMQLYQEVIFLQTFYKGLFCVENVRSYYAPLIQPQISGRHYFWANFQIPKLENRIKITRMNRDKSKLGSSQNDIRKKELEKLGFDLSKYSCGNKEKLLRNCVDPIIGKTILDTAVAIFENRTTNQLTII